MAQSQTKEDKDRFFANLQQLGESETETESEDEFNVDVRNPNHSGQQRINQIKGSKDNSEQDGIVKRPRCTPTTSNYTKAIKPNAKPAPIVIDLISPPAPTQPSRIIYKSSKSTTKKRVCPDDVEAPSKKRAKKSKDEVVLVPEDKRIFKDLVFFFVPNDNIGKLRQVRTKLVQKYGGRRADIFDSSVTHVVVEGHIEFSELSKAFPNRYIPDGTVIVQFTWFSQSIASGWLRDVKQSRFRLKGQPPMSGTEVLPLFSTPQAPLHKALHHMSTTPRTPSTSPETSKELEEIMIQVRQGNDSPLEWDDEDVTSFHSAFSTTDDKHPYVSETANVYIDIPAQNKGFQCMEANRGQNDSNPNSRTIAVLNEMARYYDRTGDHWRTTAYRKAIGALSKQSTLVATREEALRVPQIGSRLADKIEEIVTTNHLRRLESTKDDLHAQALQLFMGIYDVGLQQASQWIAQGHRSLIDLVEHAELTPNQSIGIEHYEDFLQRIPRKEVCQHATIVRHACRSIDAELQIIIGGSYRRGSADSGDIDLIITKPNANASQICALLTSKIIPTLTKAGFLKCALASSKAKAKTGSKWLGASCLPGSQVWRRIDLLYVPGNELGAALLYFTGNDVFNRSMRLLASRKGMRLNQHGLYKDVMRGPGRAKISEGTLLESQDERKIFQILDVPWREPHERQY